MGFLTAFSGTYLIAVTGNFGPRPGLGQESPACSTRSISTCRWRSSINGLAAILFMIGYVLFGVAMIRTVTLARCRRARRDGRSGPAAGFRVSSADLDRRLADRDLGQCESWRRPGLAGLSVVAHTGNFRCAFR